ncbi:MAG: TolC family protein [Treponema sp.]|nr:TolC family protein [Treponema sp.]MCL2271555.1 TolC family protein [Treponema sp.]
MNIKKRCASLLPLLFFIISAGLYAQTIRLSPDEAVQMAIKSNLGLESSRTSLETKKRASELSWNQFIPSVTVAGSLMKDNNATTASGVVPSVDLSTLLNPIYGTFNSSLPPAMQIPLLPAETLYAVTPYSVDVSPWRLAGTIQASLNLNFAMFENMKRLSLDYHGGLITYEKIKAQLERDIRKSYHNMLLLQENIALLRTAYANVERQVQMAQANYNAGLAPELTLLQAQVARENMRPTIDQAENGLKLSMAQFAMFLGMDYTTPFELEPITHNEEYAPLDVTEMISRASKEKPEIKELKQTIAMLESARTATVYSLTPSLTLSWNNNSILVGPWDNSWFNGDNWMNTGSLTISLGLRLHSLIPFSADFQGIKNMDDQIKTANLGLSQMINGTEIEVYNTVLSLERLRTSTAAQAQTVRIAEQAYRLTEQAYQAGLQDYFQVQNSLQSLQQARVQMLEQQFNYVNGLIDLEYSIGVPFGTLSGRSNQ